MKDNRPLWIAISAILLIGFLGCACAACALIGWTTIRLRSTEFVMVTESISNATTSPIPQITLTPPTIPPTQDLSPSVTGQPSAPAISPTPGSGGHTLLAPSDTLDTFENTIVPINDPIDLAQRLGGKENLPRNMRVPPVPLQLGAKDTFWVMDTDVTENFQIQATLRYITDHIYFWIEDGIPYRESHLKSLVETFESEIYPTNREFFGSEWTPGVDADAHIYILYARNLGNTVAGYFSSVDEYLPVVHEYSNAHEMFIISAENVELDEEYAYSVLAHEFQHMIHWFLDRNEETWMNEGFSDLAELLNGYDIGGHDDAYVSDPDIQLTFWPSGTGNSVPHYGAAFLFLTYFLDRFGEEATQALVSAESNGMTSIDQVLANLGMKDPLTGQSLGADDVFADWVVASYLQDDRVADGRFTYHIYPSAPSPEATENIRSCLTSPTQRDVKQYGVDYIQIDCQGEYTLRFEAPVQVGVLPVDPYSGSYAFYSNRGDESDMTLTQSFDFTAHQGPLTLTYWTWYDLEEDYDYLYLEASEDGENWQILFTPSGTAEDPSGNSYGWGYNGMSSDGLTWIQEEVDISEFAGKKIQLRFEYITDAAVNGEGFFIDDITIPEVGYFTDFEANEGGWTANGFVRIQNILPQTYQLSLIKIGANTTVERIDLPTNNLAEIPLQIGRDVEEVILVVSGTTRYTTQPALYQYSILPSSQ